MTLKDRLPTVLDLYLTSSCGPRHESNSPSPALGSTTNVHMLLIPLMTYVLFNVSIVNRFMGQFINRLSIPVPSCHGVQPFIYESKH
jgi:hypothetical protein